MNKLVLFGAGKIGRSFIAQLFSLSGYETVFIDIDKSLVDLINREKAYNILIKDTKEEMIRITNIRALYLSETNKISLPSGEFTTEDSSLYSQSVKRVISRFSTLIEYKSN